MITFILAIAVLQTDGDVPSLDGVPAPSSENFESWATKILPAEGEADWLNLPWETSYHRGLEKAANEGKPLLFWAMNGHPLGCT